MSMILDGSNGVTFNDASLQAAAASPFGLKNRIINGDMVIDQRNGGASVTPATAQYTLDRWVCYVSQSSKMTVQQNAGAVTPPAGFTNYLGVTSLSSYAVLANDFFLVQQRLEGFNVADLGWGTANAQTITVSFWARSSLTGTFGGLIKNAAATYSYPFTYSLPTANTWTKISITIPGQTAGAWPTTNSFCFEVSFGMGVGSTAAGPANTWSAADYGGATGAVSVVGTNAATWYVTGVQLERNTTATPFEWLPYGTELALCQRYYEKSYNFNVVPGTNTNVGRCNAGGTAAGLTTGFISGNRVYYKVQKRTNATITVYDAVGTSGVCTRFYLGVADTNGQSVSVADESENGWFPYSSGSANASGVGIQWVASSEL